MSSNEHQQTLGRALDFLAVGQTAEGGWAYTAGRQAYAEPTCYALLALSARQSDGARRKREQQSLAWFTKLSQPGPIVITEKGNAQPMPANIDVWGTIITFFALRRLQLGAPSWVDPIPWTG